MDAAERGIEFMHHFAERSGQRRPAADDDIVEAPPQATGVGLGRQSDNLPQPATHPVALHGVADLPRDGKADANVALIPARMRLHHEMTAGSTSAAGCGQKIAAPPEPFHRRGPGVLLTH